ncbi:hypothetical protein COV24_03100 [candidate division WWE3 bacterium CG10_big_fil_rev_8_21_14_0_10_32_10]|uniref:ABC transporter domain-containing protein n=1 Tax=candidate division WWE3 bacterium CG10_big_fil_rev_8_21_14_0_10_32_10 TaxID=1975090 RepID=A0A2H0RAB1_UNCKA|nr:MAG: hypothetical protein COV24_03100 [candidate division WWE3 bacterium CG10_big_fil_rev_8_21_14_0_10_32_10]
MIKASNLTKIYNGNTIIDCFDFVIPNNKKIALVGANGCGKSTLFKLIANIEEPTSGTIVIENEKIGYIPQEFDFKKDMLVGEYLYSLIENEWEFFKIEKLLNNLKFSNYDEYQQINNLSEGQKMKLRMIEELLKNPTALFIDEPTNHLDIEGIMWFEKYIKSLNITVVMISHDREFLNNTVDEIWEIDNSKLLKFIGNYDNYKAEKLKLINKWNEEYTRFLKRKAQLETLLENVHKIQGGGKRGRAVKAAKKRIDREITRDEKQEYVEQKINTVNFNTDVHSGKLIVKIESGAKKYDQKPVFEDLNLEIRGKERVWIYGQNGKGKSTLVKIINTAFNKEGNNNEYINLNTEETPLELTKGTITVGPNLKVGYFAQKHDFLNYGNRLDKEFASITGIQEIGRIYGVMQKFMFSKEDVIYKRVKDLSPGQRARFIFALFSVHDFDVLILDEPTNHLDIATKEVIEESLSNYKGTLILVSHDRYFVEKIEVTNTFNL